MIGAYVILAMRCADLAEPADAAGRGKCVACGAECWLCKGSVAVLAEFPSIDIVCIQCAESELKAGPPTVFAPAPKNEQQLDSARSLLSAAGATRVKGGQA